MASSANPIKNILVLSSNPINEDAIICSIKVCTSLPDLKQYISDHINDVNNFDLHMSEEYLQKLITDGVHQIEQIRHIYIYYNNNKIDLSELKYSEKFSFCRGNISEGLLENAETGTAVDPSRQIDRRTINNIVTTKSERLNEKRRNSGDHHSPDSKRSTSIVANGRPVSNVLPPFICPGCKTFFQEPYQLTCEHRLCKSCLLSQSECTICLNVILKNEAHEDQNYENTKQQLLTTCLECNWEGSFQLYQENVNQNHLGNPISNEEAYPISQSMCILPNNNNDIDIQVPIDSSSRQEHSNNDLRSEINTNATIDPNVHEEQQSNV